jgi:hypothetical protein
VSTTPRPTAPLTPRARRRPVSCTAVRAGRVQGRGRRSSATGRRSAWPARRRKRCRRHSGHRSLAGQSLPRCDRSRPPWSNTQAKDSGPSHPAPPLRVRPRCPGGCPAARFASHQGIRPDRARKLGKTRPHLRSAKLIHRNLSPLCGRKLWTKRVENLPGFFSCTPRGLHLGWSAAMSRLARDGRPQRNPLAAHKLATGCQQVIHRVVLALLWGSRQNVRAPMLDAFVETMSARAGRYGWGGGV